jgi:cobalt-zinc-cadmium efflux system membrane fusion protein
MSFNKKSVVVGTAIIAVGLIIAVWWFFIEPSGAPTKEGGVPSSDNAAGPVQSAYKVPPRPSTDPLSAQTVELSASEFEQFKVKPVEEHNFMIQREAVGNIDFNQEMLVQVFPPVPGKIITLFATVGDEVKKGETLYTIESPDLVQAESALISAAGTLNLTTHVLKRNKELRQLGALSEKDLEQAISDQQAAEGAFKASRNAVRIFGKTDDDMDRMVAQRKVDPVLVVRSPITGHVTARNAAPGLLVQPGSPVAPYTLGDVSTMWMMAKVAETDFPTLRLGEEVDVSVKAYPGRVFQGKIVRIGESVDPVTHRLLVRSEVKDSKHELRPGMFAIFAIRIGSTVRSPAVPINGVVREGDGSMTVWVTTDRKHLVKRTVKVGLLQDEYDQILEGLKPGELVVTDRALFLSNALTEMSR